MKQQIKESLDPQDLENRIKDTIHIDEFKPKMGKDEDIIVSTFKVLGHEAAKDLENFIEKGYDFVIDAETSPGEISNGKYIVFVETERNNSFPKNFMEMIKDIKNITNVDDWKIKYFERADSNKNSTEMLSLEALENIPLSANRYKNNLTAISTIESILNTARVPRQKDDLKNFKQFERKDRLWR